MIVTFNPMINTGASTDAAYMNFLRCVTAAATAAAGTTTLTVNPFTTNTGTIDSTKNCIVSIDANTEAGGWTTSASHSIVNSGSFTGVATTSQLYKADFYNASGKSGYPYNKLTFTNQPLSYASVFDTNVGVSAAMWAVVAPVMMVFGCSTTSDLTGTSYSLNAALAQSNTSLMLNGWTASSSHGAAYGSPHFWANNTNVYYRIAVTANYCIVWEVPNSNSYANGYSGLCGTGLVSSYLHPEYSYGSLMYGGLRETQPWENTYNNNPPWVGFQVTHGTKSISNGDDIVGAFMYTLNDTGVVSASPTLYVSNSSYITPGVVTNYASNDFASNGSTFSNAAATSNYGLKTPIFVNRDNSTVTSTNQSYMPVADPNTGALVPPAVPIMIRRVTSGSWNPGGAVRGIYKSLNMPLTTMKLYFSQGQTFTVGADTYFPIVFNETMYLIRNA